MLPFYTSENLQKSLVNSYAFCCGSAPPQSCLIYPNKKKEEKLVYAHGRYCMSLHHENWSLEPPVFGFTTLNRTHSILYTLPRSFSVFSCCVFFYIMICTEKLTFSMGLFRCHHWIQRCLTLWRTSEFHATNTKAAKAPLWRCKGDKLTYKLTN